MTCLCSWPSGPPYAWLEDLSSCLPLHQRSIRPWQNTNTDFLCTDVFSSAVINSKNRFILSNTEHVSAEENNEAEAVRLFQKEQNRWSLSVFRVFSRIEEEHNKRNYFFHQTKEAKTRGDAQVCLCGWCKQKKEKRGGDKDSLTSGKIQAVNWFFLFTYKAKKKNIFSF